MWGGTPSFWNNWEYKQCILTINNDAYILNGGFRQEEHRHNRFTDKFYRKSNTTREYTG